MEKTKWDAVKELVYGQIKSYVMFACAYEANNELLRDAVMRFLSRILLKPLSELGILAEWEVRCGEDVNNKAVVDANAFKLEFRWKEDNKHDWTIAEFTLAPDGLKLIEKSEEDE